MRCLIDTNFLSDGVTGVMPACLRGQKATGIADNAVALAGRCVL